MKLSDDNYTGDCMRLLLVIEQVKNYNKELAFLRRIFRTKKTRDRCFFNFTWWIIMSSASTTTYYITSLCLPIPFTLYVRNVILQKRLSFCLRAVTSEFDVSCTFSISRAVWCMRSEFLASHCAIDKALGLGNVQGKCSDKNKSILSCSRFCCMRKF